MQLGMKCIITFCTAVPKVGCFNRGLCVFNYSGIKLSSTWASVNDGAKFCSSVCMRSSILALNSVTWISCSAQSNSAIWVSPKTAAQCKAVLPLSSLYEFQNSHGSYAWSIEANWMKWFLQLWGHYLSLTMPSRSGCITQIYRFPGQICIAGKKDNAETSTCKLAQSLILWTLRLTRTFLSKTIGVNQRHANSSIIPLWGVSQWSNCQREKFVEGSYLLRVAALAPKSKATILWAICFLFGRLAVQTAACKGGEPSVAFSKSAPFSISNWTMATWPTKSRLSNFTPLYWGKRLACKVLSILACKILVGLLINSKGSPFRIAMWIGVHSLSSNSFMSACVRCTSCNKHLLHPQHWFWGHHFLVIVNKQSF